jgi:DNA-binding SARP family transcriptional activator
LRSRFEKALEWYEQAEERSRTRGDNPGIGQALRGQARVYLDTVDASKAERLLQEALQLSDGQADRESQARLLILLAENMLNQGHFKEAELYQAKARQLRREGPGEAEIPVRLLLRSGKLDQARRLLDKQVEAERREPVLRPRAHRETLLLLSLVLAFQGERELAYQTALEGTERGRALDSPFITAVGYMRQGHAWLLSKDDKGYARARRCFLEAVRLSETLDVPRLKVEANWGLVQAFGFCGDLEMARSAGEVGIAIAQAVGDQWIEGSIDLVLGASHTLAAQFEPAAEWLTKATLSFRDCGDTYGEAVSRLWLNHLWWLTRDETRLHRDVGDLLHQVQRHQYDYLFQRKTLLGPPDPRTLVPLLLFARRTGQNRPYAEQLLGQLGLGNLEIHPGYQLRVQALGRFSVWRGQTIIGRKEWKRKKALQLFQLLLTHRGRMLERDQITESLWPELDPEVAQRDFKIAYSTLNRVLEPARDRNTPAAFLLRDDTLYGLRPEADIWSDVEEVDRLITRGDALFETDVEAALPHYRRALALYQGQYLQEVPYAEWCTEERERLHALTLRTADRLARTLVAKGSWEEAIEVCQIILSHDDCWEQAYRLMMTAYDRLGNRVQALRTYQRCQERLHSELGVRPSPATVELHLTIQKGSTQDQKNQPKKA